MKRRPTWWMALQFLTLLQASQIPAWTRGREASENLPSGVSSLAQKPARVNPLEAPQELMDFASRVTSYAVDSRAKLQHLARGFFAPESEGGLGITYDNSYTRTIQEGYRDRKANCFTLTAMYIACCRNIGVEARYAESLRISHWRRVGSAIRYERHLVAMMKNGAHEEARVADFLPELTQGSHHLVPITSRRALALFHSNRAVELMNSEQLEEALATT